MKAKKGLKVEKRKLADLVPLSTPYLFYVYPICACNFRCGYCLYSLGKAPYDMDPKVLGLKEFKMRIDELKAFDDKLRLIRFAGMGEPLLHKQIVEMVRYAKESEVAESVDIITNGSLLTKEMSLALVEASLDKIKISIQGLGDDAYESMSGTRIDFEDLVDNIRFLYEHKKQLTIYIKTVDASLPTQEAVEQFYSIFGDICDEISIEHIYPATPEIDYKKFDGFRNDEKTVLGYDYDNVQICPQPFYTMTLEPDNGVGFCCAYDTSGIVHDPKGKSRTMAEIWHSEEHMMFLKRMLSGVENADSNCVVCTTYKYAGIHPNDKLDHAKDHIMRKIEAKLQGDNK